ncbi:MAG: 30S ribosomal protein S4e, partial [Thermoplasmata archaeon]|nr:30S ribosomal protein S4e [Thermoplasmata archaeon]
PLIMAVRDVLGLANTSREVRKIIGERKIYVDGKATTDYRFPLGLMDVLSIPSIKKYYRVLMDPQGKIGLFEIIEEKAGWKLVRIDNKTIVKGGFTQLNLHDGRNIIVQRQYRTKDVLKITIPGQELIAHFPFEPGKICMITGGKHNGRVVTIDHHEIMKGPNPNIVYFKEGVSTIEDYVFIIGDRLPEVVVPEVKVHG